MTWDLHIEDDGRVDRLVPQVARRGVHIPRDTVGRHAPALVDVAEAVVLWLDAALQLIEQVSAARPIFGWQAKVAMAQRRTWVRVRVRVRV